ncbi:MAG: type III-A CRISPR-associated protein Csm2 [Armatimonadetes bacterium]|nr:type III-A CRISPR-associated protein Csm2 [Armatimonadota bacterium]
MARVFNEVDNPAELVIKDAEELAQLVADKDQGTRSQMRRFYQEFVKLRQGVPAGDEVAYKRNEVALKMLVAKAAYATGRKNSKVSAKFKDWLQKNVRAITCAQDVHTFGDYYEAFIGFFYAQTPDGQQSRPGGQPQGGRRYSQGGGRR